MTSIYVPAYVSYDGWQRETMTKQIGERFELSEDAAITLYHDGGATLTVPLGTVTLDAAEVTALKRAFAAQEAS